jgi:hypothetical protein
MKESPAKKQRNERNNATKLIVGGKKIRFYPKREDRYKLEQWFDANRCTYNKLYKELNIKRSTQQKLP